MHLDVKHLPNGTRALLREELTIASVSEDRDRLVQLLQPDGEVELDLEGVTEIDTAGVQLLVALRKEAEAMGCACHIAGSGESVLDAFGRLGLGGHLKEPLVGTGVRRGS